MREVDTEKILKSSGTAGNSEKLILGQSVKSVVDKRPVNTVRRQTLFRFRKFRMLWRVMTVQVVKRYGT